MTEDTIEVHGRTAERVEFGAQEGVYVGGRHSGGDCPRLDIVLCQYHVYVIHADRGDVLCQTDIDFEYQYFDQDDNPVDEDDPERFMGEPTEPIEGAVEEAISEASSMASGFMDGWSERHRMGPGYAEMQAFADSLDELDRVEVTGVRETKEEIEAVVDLVNPAWGMPSELYEWLQDHPTLELVDFDSVAENRIVVHIDRDTSRRPRY